MSVLAPLPVLLLPADAGRPLTRRPSSPTPPWNDVILSSETVLKLRDLNQLLVAGGLNPKKPTRSANVITDKLIQKFERYRLPWKVLTEYNEYVKLSNSCR